MSKKSKTLKAPTSLERLEAIGLAALCAFIENGDSLRSFCITYSLPLTTVHDWIGNEDHPERAEQYARAREARADKLADEILQIADDSSNDTYVDGDGNVKTDHEVVARSRLRVDSRKWLAGKMAPKKYGDRQILSGDPDAPLNPKVDLSALSDAELQTLAALQRKIEGKQ